MNAWFDKGYEYVGTQGINLATADLRLALVSSDYSFSAADEFYSVPEAFQVAAPVALSGKAFTGNILTADPVTWPAVSFVTAAGSYAILFEHNGGASSTWRLLAYIDTADGLPVTPIGDDIVFTPKNSQYALL